MKVYDNLTHVSQKRIFKDIFLYVHHRHLDKMTKNCMKITKLAFLGGVTKEGGRGK